METSNLYKVSAQEARVQLSDMINRAIYSHQPSLITRQGKSAAVLISFKEWQAFQQWQQTSSISSVDPMPDPGELYPPVNLQQDQVAVDLAITTDQVNDSK